MMRSTSPFVASSGPLAKLMCAEASQSEQSKERSIVTYYVTILRRVLRRRRKLVGFLAASLMHAAGHAFLALAAGAMVAALAGFPPISGVRGPPTSALGWVRGGDDSLGSRAFFWSAVGLAIVVAKGAAGVYATYVQGRLSGEVGSALRLELLDSLLAVHRLRRPRQDDHGLDEASPIARGVAALTERVHEVELGLKDGLLGGVRAVAQLVPLGVLLVALSPRTAAVAALALGTFGALLRRIRAAYRAASARAGQQRAHLLEAADESVRHADLWVTYGAEGRARRRVTELADAIACGSAKLDARGAALSGANEALGAAALVVALGLSRAGVVGTPAGGGTLLAFAIAFFLAYRPLRELADARLALARAESAYEELRRILHLGLAVLPVEGDEPQPARRDRPWRPATLELRSLRLGRGGCGPVSLEVEAGAVVVIMGPTGVGKTTLLRTLLGLERPAGGEVLFGGVSLAGAAPGPVARPFAWVPQEAPLLGDTLDANLRLGTAEGEPGADPWALLDPLGAAHLAGSLGASRLGGGGRAVSGGERQWIALARAIATCQPVLLLDEPTSGLDAEAQRRVLQAIARLRGRRTVLLVTHRPEPTKIADHVVHLRAGPLGNAA